VHLSISTDRRKKRELLIISASPSVPATENPKVFEPTLREIESLAPYFDRIVWFTYPIANGGSALYRVPAYPNISILGFPAVQGGRNFYQKFRLLTGLFGLTKTVFMQMSKFDYIHTRGPSVPALLAILMSTLLSRKKYWHKYAGNWGEPSPPLAFGIQRWLLKKSKHSVTISGRWSERNPNIISFENPCFWARELISAQRAERSFASRPLRVLFVGRLEVSKGIHVVLEAARCLASSGFEFILVGPGRDQPEFAPYVSTLPNLIFRGEMGRSALNEEYSRCHFLVLPSFTEGFPKVVSEACGFGCIPIATDVSSIGQYITRDVGFLIARPEAPLLVKTLLQATDYDLERMSFNARTVAQLFTYERFANRIMNEVFGEGAKTSE